MPIIPIIQEQRPTSDADAPVFDRIRRPALDTAPIQQGLARVNEAGKMPLQDPAAAAAPFEALGSVGRAVQQAGNLLGALAIKRQEAEADFQAAEFDKRMDMELADFEKWKSGKLNSPWEWEPQWGERLGKLRREYSEKKLNNLAREQIGLRLTRWEGQSTAGVARDATKHTFLLAKSASLSSAESALQAGDYERHAEIVQTGLAKGYLFPHEATAERQRATNEQIRRAKLAADTALEGPNPRLEEARKSIQESPLPDDEKRLELARIEGRFARQKEKQDLQAIAYDDPDRAAELAAASEKAGKISGLDRVDIEQQAMQAKSFRRKTAVNEYKERLYMKDLPTADELKADTRLSDFDRYSIAAMATGQVNDPAEFESALAAAMTFDPTKFKDEREAVTSATNLEASFETRFEGPYLSALKAELEKRQKRTLDTATEATDIGPALKLLDEEIERGALGPISKPVLENGKPVMRDPKKQGFTQDSKEGYKFNPWEFLPFGFLSSDNQPITKPSGGPVDVMENDGKPVPLTEPDPVAREKAAAVQRDIRRTLESEVKDGKLKDQAAITARAIQLFKIKGGKMAPREGGAPNETLPPANWQHEKNDVNDFIDTYGN